MNTSIIVIIIGENMEAWGSLSEICRTKGFSYNYLKRKSFPFTYKSIEFWKLPFRKENGI